MSPKGRYGKWILGHNAVIKINDVLFAHGGIAPALGDMSLEKINRSIRDELANPARTDGGLAMDPSGPLWYRGLAVADGEYGTLRADLALKAFGASRIVVGHTVSKEGIEVRAGGRVIMIDVGLSACYGGPAACLEIDAGKYYAVTPGGREALAVGTGD